jgi:integrase
MGRGSGVRRATQSSIAISFQYRGVRCRERLRLSPTPQNLKHAARLKATVDHEIAIGTFDYSKHFPDSKRAKRFALGPGAKILLRTALRDYCESLKGSLEKETVRDYTNDAEIVAGWFPKDRSLAEVSRAEIRKAIAKQDLSRQRISNMIRPLRGTFEQALEDGSIPENPLHGFKIKKLGRRRETVDPFEPEEITELAKIDVQWLIWAWTGLRSGEIAGLRWADVDLEGERIHVRRAVRLGREKTPKTETGNRVVTLLPPARDALAALEQRRPDDPVFMNPNTSERWHEAKALNRAFARACMKAQVRRRYAYQLRHTFATWALSAGENPAWIAKQMGHKDVQVIYDHYAKWMPRMDLAAGSRMVKAAKPKATLGQRRA